MNESDYRNIQLIRDNLDVFNKHIYNEPMDGWDVSERRMSDYEFFHTVTTLMANFEPRFYAICEGIASEGNDIPIPLRQLINVLADTDRLNIVGYDDDVKLWANKWAGIFSRVTVWLRFLDETFPNYNWGVQQMNRWFGHHRTVTSTGNPTTGDPFVARLLASEWFQKEINAGYIPKECTKPPIPWKGTIKELAISLSESGLLSSPRIDNLTEKTTKWKNANKVFTINGEPITNEQLKKGFQR